MPFSSHIILQKCKSLIVALCWQVCGEESILAHCWKECEGTKQTTYAFTVWANGQFFCLLSLTSVPLTMLTFSLYPIPCLLKNILCFHIFHVHSFVELVLFWHHLLYHQLSLTLLGLSFIIFMFFLGNPIHFYNFIPHLVAYGVKVYFPMPQ